MLLQLTDGTDAVTLSGDGGVLRGCTYFPQPPEHGGAEDGDVTETAEITLRGASSSVRAAANRIERMFGLAAARQAGVPGPRVFVQYAAADGDPLHRSEALEGRLVWSKDPGLRRLSDPAPTVQAAVIWRRRPYWEGPEAALPAAQIVNGDGGNTVLWDAVAGALPTPARITLTNADASSFASYRFLIHNDASDLFGAGGAFLYPTQPSVSWSSGLRHNQLLWRLDVPPALAAKLKGERHRVVAAFSSLSSDIYLRANVFTVVGSLFIPLQAGGELLAGSTGGRDLLDLGALNLPPSGDIGASAAYALVLTGAAAAAGSGTLRWVHISPAAPFLRLRQQGLWLSPGGSVVHDGMEGVSYLALAQRHPIVEAAGELLLYPGRSNRIRILFDEGSTFVPERRLLVSGAYRPRRLTV